MGAGFSLSRSQSSAEFVGTTELFDVAADNARIIAKGDVVIITGESTVTPVNKQVAGRSQVETAADGAVATRQTGIVEAIAPDLANEALNDAGGLAALTAGTLFVIVDGNTLFEAESDATILAAQVGLNIGFVATEAVKTGGLTISGFELDGSSAATTITLPFRIVKLLKGKDTGILGDRALVRLNATTANNGAAGI